MLDENILLVEDNPDDEALTLRALSKSSIPHTVDVVTDGKAAVDYIRNLKSNKGRQRYPRLVIMDLNLPKLSGTEAIREIRALTNGAHIPIVVLTTSGDEGDISSAYKCGANSYTRKPVEFQTFQELLESMLVYWLNFNEHAKSFR